ETVQIPTAGPTPLPPIGEFVQGDERTTNGESVISAPVVGLGGSVLSGTMAYCCTFSSAQLATISDGTATFDAAGRMTGISDAIGQNFFADPDVTKIVDFGNDGIIAWGRWTGNVTGAASIDGLNAINEIYDANKGLHYVVGAPTALMPQIGTATYSLLGATRPTLTDGSASPGTFSGSLTVNFDVSNPIVRMNLNVAVGGLGYLINGNAGISGNTFSGSYSDGAGMNGTNSSSCLSGCSSSVAGFFAGAAAERAGLAYKISDSFAGKDVLGAAAFKKQ
ncbi:MAG: hypothetical protein ABI423_04475, partial [Burkholderiales bacterium]